MANKTELAEFVKMVRAKPGITKSELAPTFSDRHAIAGLIKAGELMSIKVDHRSAKLYINPSRNEFARSGETTAPVVSDAFTGPLADLSELVFSGWRQSKLAIIHAECGVAA